MNRLNQISVRRAAGFIAVGLGLWIVLGACDADTQRRLQAFVSDAEGIVSDLQGQADTVFISGDPDYSIAVSFRVKNVGKAGIIKISPWLSTSEGEWSRVQNMTFSRGETKILKYSFHEPTINATNIQYGVKVHPRPGKKSKASVG